MLLSTNLRPHHHQPHKTRKWGEIKIKNIYMKRKKNFFKKKDTNPIKRRSKIEEGGEKYIWPDLSELQIFPESA